MGCDIHPHIEYMQYENPDGKPVWWHYCDFFFLRDYTLFATMAGVRKYDSGIVPVAEPRGVPDDMAYETKSDFTYLVVDEATNEDGVLSRAEARQRVDRGWSEWIGDPDAKYARITNPDWHTPSWLTTDEFAAAIELAEKWRSVPCAANVHAALAVMRAFEQRGLKARLIFWFDN